MKEEATSSAISFVFKMAAQGASGAAAGASTAAVATGASDMSLVGAVLLGVSGACGVIGAMFFKANDKESAAKDTAVTIVFPFCLAVAIGPTLGVMIYTRAGLEGVYQTTIAEHMLGGLAAGAGATPIIRHAIAAPISKIFEALKRLAGGDK